MFYHFLVWLILRISTTVKKDISKLKQCFSPSVQELEGNMNTWMSHQLLHQPTQFFRAPMLSEEPLLKFLRKQDAHYVTEGAHKNKIDNI